MLMAILASVMLAAGLIPPYFELAKRNGRVVGISKRTPTRPVSSNILIRTDFIFLTVDWAGAFFSLMALVAQNTFDILGGSLYIVWYITLSLGLLFCSLTP
jgi:hypothetical protein